MRQNNKRTINTELSKKQRRRILENDKGDPNANPLV